MPPDALPSFSDLLRSRKDRWQTVADLHALTQQTPYQVALTTCYSWSRSTVPSELHQEAALALAEKLGIDRPDALAAIERSRQPAGRPRLDAAPPGAPVVLPKGSVGPDTLAIRTLALTLEALRSGTPDLASLLNALVGACERDPGLAAAAVPLDARSISGNLREIEWLVHQVLRAALSQEVDRTLSYGEGERLVRLAWVLAAGAAVTGVPGDLVAEVLLRESKKTIVSG